MHILFKDGVIFKEFNNFYQEVFNRIDSYFLQVGHTPTITSATDGKHMDGSYHYRNRAVDVRIRDFDPQTWEQHKDRLQAILGPDFQVLLEADKVHIHIEPSDDGKYA